jgi:hypothetical protein
MNIDPPVAICKKLILTKMLPLLLTLHYFYPDF